MSRRHPLARLFPEPLWSALRPKGERGEDLFGLAQNLGVEPLELSELRLGRRYHYRPFTIAKPDGRERRILAPSPALKCLQRKLLDEYLVHLPIHPAATAFHPGSSTLNHARPHAHSAWVATVDLQDFFETTRAGRVRKFFSEQRWSKTEVQVLMRLCVFGDGLPQGAPTSPCLSNLVNVRLDERLDRLVRRSGGVYTRYGDDLTFSWPQDPPREDFYRAVEDVLGAVGYSVQPRKSWRVTSARKRPVITGVVVAGDGRLRVPWSMRMQAALLRWRALWSRSPEVRSRATGLHSYLRMIDRAAVFVKLRGRRR